MPMTNAGHTGTMQRLTDHLFRTYYGKMVAYLTAKYGFNLLDAVLDAIQEAFEAALRTWKFGNLPADQFAWLYQVAQRKLLNGLKKSATHQKHVSALAEGQDLNLAWNEEEAEVDLLYLLFFFARLPYGEKTKLAVTLYFLCGFSRKEVAKALLSKEETIKKMLSRSKDYIKKYAVSYRRFAIHQKEEDIAYLLKVLYLLFNEGYKSSNQKVAIEFDLCFEAMRLAKLLHVTYPKHVELNALLALQFFTAARFPARVDSESHWVDLAEQDRKLYEPQLMKTGYYYLEQAKIYGLSLTKYYLEALISSLHCSALSYADTDWRTISFLYAQLEALEPLSLAPQVNRLIAASHFEPKNAILDELVAIEVKAARNFLFTILMAKAYVHRLHNDWVEARHCYEEALTKDITVLDKVFIGKKLAALS